MNINIFLHVKYLIKFIVYNHCPKCSSNNNKINTQSKIRIGAFVIPKGFSDGNGGGVTGARRKRLLTA